MTEQTTKKKPMLLTSVMVVFFAFAMGWAYQFTGGHRGGVTTGILKAKFAFMGVEIYLLQAAVLLLGIGVTAIMLYKSFNTFYEVLASVQFATIIGLALALATIVGTLIKQKVAPKEYLATYGEMGTRLIKNLFIGNIFASYWFLLLMFLLFSGLIAVTIKRKQFTVEKWGFFFAHAGVVVLLLGGWMGMGGHKGMINFRIGRQETKNDFYDQKTRALSFLPFSLKLKRFNIEYYPEELKIDVYKMSKNHKNIRRIAAFPLDKTTKELQTVPNTSYQMKVLQYFPQMGWKEEFLPLSAKKNPKEKLRIINQVGFQWTWKKKKGKVIFYPSDFRRANKAFDNMELVIFASEKKAPKDLVGSFPSGKIPANQQLILSIIQKHPGGKKTKKHPPIKRTKFKFVVGKEYTFFGYKLKVLRYVPDFTIDTKTKEITSRSSMPKNPAVQVQVTRGKKKAVTWLFSRQFHGHKPSGFKKMGVNLKYQYNRATRGFGRYLLMYLGSKEIIELAGNKIVGREPIGTHYKSKNTDLEISKLEIIPVRRRFYRANLSKHPRNPAVETAFYKDGKEVKRQWLVLSRQQPLLSPDGKYALSFRRDKDIKQYTSHLEVWENNRKVKEKLINVNDPLWHKGYAFYQANYDGRARIDGIEVVKDKGVFLVLLGMLLIAIGVPYIFYIQPPLRARKKKALQKQILAEKGE